MPTPHKCAEAIKAYADGEEIQEREFVSKDWRPFDGYFRENWQYRVKPAAPKWPQTTMSIGRIVQAYQDGAEKGEALMCAVNAVLAHECSTSALVPADKVREISAEAYAQGAKSACDPVAIIEAVFDHLRAGIADPESIQAILLRAAK